VPRWHGAASQAILQQSDGKQLVGPHHEIEGEPQADQQHQDAEQEAKLLAADFLASTGADGTARLWDVADIK